jgi:hypothetical protein
MLSAVWASAEEESSPWLLTPTISSDPKLGTSIGFMGAYIHQFDEQSPPSMFGITGSYSDTDSYIYAGFIRGFFDNDKHRVMGVIVGGKIENDFEDFLGTGQPLQSTDSLNIAAIRYLRLIKDHWYLGLQFISTNYVVYTEDWLSGRVLDLVGLTGFRSNGLGLAVNYDSRDNQNSPTSGTSFEVHNIAYRESLGGELSFDAYTTKYATYFAHGKGHVLALHAKGRWTDDAPPSGYSTVELRGYTRGQFLAPHMTLIELEERIKVAERWGITLSAGLASLYGGNEVREENNDIYPSVVAGIIYAIKPVEKMVMRAEFGFGKSGNHAFYLRFGHPF